VTADASQASVWLQDNKQRQRQASKQRVSFLSIIKDPDLRKEQLEKSIQANKDLSLATL
jgi:hypothetical protein